VIKPAFVPFFSTDGYFSGHDMKAKEKKPASPEPEQVNPKGNWAQAIKDALKKTKPKGGWPEPDGRYGSKKK